MINEKLLIQKNNSADTSQFKKPPTPFALSLSKGRALINSLIASAAMAS